MTTIEQLKQSILADAAAEASRLDAESEAQVRMIQAETDSLVAAQKKKMLERAERKAQLESRIMDAKAQMEENDRMSGAKNAVIDDVFERAEIALSGKIRRETLASLWERARKRIDARVVTVDPEDAAIFKSLKAKGVVVKTVQLGGGFIASSEDGKLHVDCTFKTLLEVVRQKRSADIAEILFEEKVTERGAVGRRRGNAARRSGKGTGRIAKSLKTLKRRNGPSKGTRGV